MYPYPILTLGKLSIHLYGVMIALGLLGCFAVLFLYTKKKKIDEKFVDFLFYNGVASIVLGFLGAMLFQAFYNYLDNPEEGFRFGSGMTFIGGLIIGAAVFLSVYFIFRKRLTARLVDVISIVPCCILIAHAFGRIGCLFAGCCYGVETDSIFGMQFVGLSHPVHPTQLYEAIFLFIMFGVCSYLVLKHDYQHNLSLYLLTYGIFRFLLEFVRGDDRGSFIAGLSPSQFWSLVMVVLSVGVYFAMRYLLQRRAKELQLK